MTTTHPDSAAPFVLDAGGDTSITLPQIGPAAARAEADGADGVVVSETKHDPFVSLTIAAQATERVDLFSGIAVAFARSPMTLAMQANDIQELSGGRLVLGLGSQVQQHIERRFSMPWSRPAARMRDFVLATRAIWSAWETGERLNYRGEFYTHTLMSPFFDPGPNPHGNAPIWVAAVGERMTETAGEVADGVVAHTFTTRLSWRSGVPARSHTATVKPEAPISAVSMTARSRLKAKRLEGRPPVDSPAPIGVIRPASCREVSRWLTVERERPEISITSVRLSSPCSRKSASTSEMCELMTWVFTRLQGGEWLIRLTQGSF